MKLETILRDAGWCCPWAFFEANKKTRTGLLAAKLGVAESTVREWRGFHARGQIFCPDHRRCMLVALKAPIPPVKHSPDES